MSTLKTNNIQHVDRSDPSIIINTDGSVNIAGTMTYEDVTNVDSVGIITGRELINAQKQVHVGTGVSIKAGGLNVTAGISTFGGNVIVNNTTATAGSYTYKLLTSDNISSSEQTFGIQYPSVVTYGLNAESDAAFTIKKDGTERLRIDSSGRLLKGTTSTVSVGNGANTQLVGSAGADASLALIRQAAGGGELYFAAGTSGTNISSGNGLGFIKFMGYHTNGYDEYARIQSYADGTTGDGDAPGRLVFATTADGASSPTERLRIDSSGKVNIGNTGSSWVGPLSIGSGASGQGQVLQIYSNSDTYGAIFFGDATSGADRYVGSINYYHDNNYMRFDTAGVERLRIDSNGLVKITKSGSAANAKLEIAQPDGGGGTSEILFSDAVSARGRVFYDHGSNPEGVKIEAAGTLTLIATTAGRIGINTDNPQAKLQVNDINPVTAEFYRKNGGTNDESRIALGALSSNIPSQRGILLTAVNNGAGHDFKISTSPSHSLGPTEKARVLSSGGMTFNGDTSSDNALDDYEEGLWTPTFSTSSGSITANSSYDKASYTKIGRLVHLTGQVVVAPNSPGGNLTIGGMPFPVGNLTELAGRSFCTFTAYFNGSPPDGNALYTIQARLTETNSNFLCEGVKPHADGSIADWVGSGTDFFFDITYFAAT